MSWERGADFLGWLRAPIAEKYLGKLRDQREEARKGLMAAASTSDDPNVRQRFATWKTLDEQTTYLEKSRREGVDDDA